MSKERDAALAESSAARPEAPAQSSHASVQPPADAPRPGVGSKYRLRQEEPTLQQELLPAYAVDEGSDLSVGNHDYTIELKEEGNLGVFLDISRTAENHTIIEIDAVKYFTGIFDTLSEVLLRCMRQKTTLTDVELLNRANSIAEDLATGCCVISYLKMRAVHFIDAPDRTDSLRKPKVAENLPIPAPFAFAIQQLGAVTPTDCYNESRLVPAFKEGTHNTGAPTGHNWRPTAYAQAMEYARTLGLRFNIVDLAVKNGTSWWLLRGYWSAPVFELQCIFPEVNYTDSMAVTYSLWLKNTEEDPSNDFANIDAITDTYAIILRNPHVGINISTYFALEATAEEVWKNA